MNAKIRGVRKMHNDPRVERWASFLDTQSWDNLDELAKIIVSELDALEGE